MEKQKEEKEMVTESEKKKRLSILIGSFLVWSILYAYLFDSDNFKVQSFGLISMVYILYLIFKLDRSLDVENAN